MSTARWVWVIVALQVIGLLGWAGYHEMQRRGASVIRLKVRPVDPRDVLRGDYMILRYDISEHPKPAGWKSGDRDVYVVLAPAGAFHAIADLRLTPPDAAEPRLWVRATARPQWREGASDNLHLRYGIEEFFVPEGRGQGRFDGLEAEVGVSATHRLYLKRLFLGGKPFP